MLGILAKKKPQHPQIQMPSCHRYYLIHHPQGSGCPDHEVERAAALLDGYSSVLDLLPNPLNAPLLVHRAFTPSFLIAAGFCVFDHNIPVTHVAGPDKFFIGL